MPSLYNNLTSVGRIKMQVESAVMWLAAAVMVCLAAYQLFLGQPKAARNRRAAMLFIGALLAALLAWVLASASSRTNSFSTLLAASSGLNLFAAPFIG